MPRLLTLFSLLVFALIVGPILAQNPNNKSVSSKQGSAKQGATKSGADKHATPKGKNPVRNMPNGITAAREAAVVAFVKEHHPELSELLAVLKTSQPKEYYKAVRDLFRVSERLAQIQEVNSELYDLELKVWQLKSRIDLLTARLKMSPKDKGLQAELKDALLQRINARKELLSLEHRRVTTRLEKLDAQIEKLQKSHDQLSRQQLQNLLKTTRPASTPVKKSGRSVKKPTP